MGLDDFTNSLISFKENTMLGKLLGKVISLPVRVVNLPAQVIDSAADVLDGGDGRVDDDERVVSAPLDATADFIETVCEEALDD